MLQTSHDRPHTMPLAQRPDRPTKHCMQAQAARGKDLDAKERAALRATVAEEVLGRPLRRGRSGAGRWSQQGGGAAKVGGAVWGVCMGVG